jgi:hypothetical protein
MNQCQPFGLPVRRRRQEHTLDQAEHSRGCAMASARVSTAISANPGCLRSVSPRLSSQNLTGRFA